MATQPKPFITPQQYLEIERNAEYKSEYISGDMIAMSGASYKHGIIVLNLASRIKQTLKGKPCDTLAGDIRVRATTTSYLYPDIVLMCGYPEFEDANVDTLLNPLAVVEVLSKSTEAYDRGEKFFLYRQIESLQVYILVSQEKHHIEWYIKQTDDQWLLSEVKDIDSILNIPRLDIQIPLSDIYERVSFETNAVA